MHAEQVTGATLPLQVAQFAIRDKQLTQIEPSKTWSKLWSHMQAPFLRVKVGSQIRQVR